MTVIGVTGGSGAGKTTLLSLMKTRGFYVTDADQLYHRMLESDKEMIAEIERRFPGVCEDGKVRRAELAGRVFGDPAALRDLNAITHARVLGEVRRDLHSAAGAGERLAAVDAAGLFESGFDRECDFTIGVLAPRDTRLARIMARDGLTERQASLRIEAQKDDDFYRRNCDYCIVNDGDRSGMERKLDQILADMGI